MDCALVLRDGAPHLREAGAGAARASRWPCAGPGIRVRPPERSRDYSVFGFMSNDISAEINKGIVIAGTAREMRRDARGGREDRGGGRARPSSTPAATSPLARLVRDGWVDVLLTGNAFAAHDLEKAILKTSLGVCQMSGRAVEGGSRNHLYAINAVNRAGGIRAGGGVRARDARASCTRSCKKGIPFVLAGSIRDDGPLKDVITDTAGRAEGLRRGARGARACA